MASRQLDEEAIFHVAREIHDPDTRSRYLDQICAGDHNLRGRVDELLRIHEQENAFLKSSSNPGPTEDHAPISEEPGQHIGRYKLMEQIGEGGMGVVFVAEQERPVRRRVAVKIVKPGMDSKEVIARFEAERQALALMNHPNIAKVLDAGSTESGRPYFVMELVRGISITEYCDQNKLSIRERLDLFTQVCQALQHAHQKGIIHRDVKPSNVLVTLHDGKPVPKVIDFGVAKAINQRLTERTIYTRFSQIIGTPMYMSPEQAEMSGLDVDTRSDIYSLGVVLYELLTGSTPFDREKFAEAAYDEIRRIVREEEPPKPSTKISTLGETATSISTHRGTDPRSLSRFIMGDLDIIVMKAIEKDRTRRYDTASSLAADVERFLKNEPIVARSPSLAYRFTKFARRNRVAMVTSALVVISLVAATVATSSMAIVARQEKGRAEEECGRVTETLQMLAESFYAKAVSYALGGDQEEAQKALEEASTGGASRSRVLVLEGLMALNTGMYDDAIDLAERAMDDGSFLPESEGIGVRAVLAVASLWAGYDDRWAQELQHLRQLQPASNTDHLLKAYVLVQYDPFEAMSLLEKTPGIQRSPVGLIIRGWHRNWMGVDKQDAELLDAAVRDFEYVQFLFHDNRGPVGWRTWALVSAIELATHEGRHEDVLRYTREARPLAERLATFTDYPSGDFCRWMFYRAAGESRKASRAIRKVGHHPGTYSWFLAADCLRWHRGAAAVNEFATAIAAEHKQSKYVRLAKAHLVRDLPDGAKDVQKLAGDLVTDLSPLVRRHALLALCLAEDRDEIEKRACEAPAVISSASGGSDVWIGKAYLEYLAGRLTEPELLEGASQHGYSRAAAHFTIAMLRLAARDRAGAHEHFRMSVATNTIGGFDYEWARAYLARMDGDPAWPSWVGDKAAE